MSEIRNKIITISGEPVSGKSTLVKILKDKYEKMGFNVHIISVGNTFRELAKQEYLRMYPDRTEANISDIQTDYTFKEKRNLIDSMVDQEVERRGKEINKQERPQDVYIVDSRLAWNNIPESYAIRLTVNETIAGTRVFKDKNRGSEDKYETLEDAIEKTKERKQAEIERYKKRYNVDLTNQENYDLIVNTSYSKSEELANIIIKGEEKYRNGEWYPKNWKSPALFLPSQKLGETIEKSPTGFSLEDISESIKENGYSPDSGTVNVIQKDGIDILKDGHHRALGMIAAGKTLLPYEITNEDDKIAKDYAYGEVKLNNVYDWEDAIKYYANIGGIESLKDFEVSKVIPFEKIEEFSKKDRSNNDEER